MNKVNILHVIATLDIGGAEKQLVELVKRTDKKKFNPVVCCLTRGGALEEELKKTKIEYLVLGKKFKLDFSATFKLIPILKQKNIHILHTWMFTSNFFGRIAGLFAHTPIMIASERGFDRWKNRFHLLIDWAFSHFTDKIICVSEGVKNFYNKQGGVPLYKLITIYNGIDTNSPLVNEYKKKTLNLEKDSIVITNIGHLISYKGLKYLLHATSEIIKNFPKARLLIAGEGPQKNELEKLAKKLNISDYVIFLGLRRDIKEILSITDIFVLPSLVEGLPNAIMEAMFGGKPVVATNIPGNDELVVNGETGVLVPAKNINSLASAIINLLKNPQKAKDMGLKGREKVETLFPIDKTIKKTEELYESLIKLKNLKI